MKLTTIRLSVIEALAGLSYSTRHSIWAKRLRPLEKPSMDVLP